MKLTQGSTGEILLLSGYVITQTVIENVDLRQFKITAENNTAQGNIPQANAQPLFYILNSYAPVIDCNMTLTANYINRTFFRLSNSSLTIASGRSLTNNAPQGYCIWIEYNSDVLCLGSNTFQAHAENIKMYHNSKFTMLNTNNSLTKLDNTIFPVLQSYGGSIANINNASLSSPQLAIEVKNGGIVSCQNVTANNTFSNIAVNTLTPDGIIFNS
jgi:hypothetical protein